jgi:UDP:flavonoid glycosyltransferase YjiC (YdhE family)
VLAPVAQLRAELKVPPGAHPLFEGQHAPDRVLGLFSPQWAAPQRDWPSQTRLTGFCFYDGAQELSAEVRQFLDGGAPPLVFTLGASSIHDARDFFAQSLEAVRSARRRALFIAGDKMASLSSLPPGVMVVPYAPLSAILPRAAALVQHGGAGTGALALRAGCPMLIVPQANDQPDNAVRFERMGVARVLWRHEYAATRVARELDALLGSAEYSYRAARVREHITREDGAAAVCDCIEEELHELA